MTSAFEADLGGRHPLTSPECAVACHTTGEPGTNDGGFSHVFESSVSPRFRTISAELPRALRRLGGVGCLACHGPARVPPDSARWAVLRSDVCATCHDAPPRYGHVAAFATTTWLAPIAIRARASAPPVRVVTRPGARAGRRPDARPPRSDPSASAALLATRFTENARCVLRPTFASTATRRARASERSPKRALRPSGPDAVGST